MKSKVIVIRIEDDTLTKESWDAIDWLWNYTEMIENGLKKIRRMAIWKVWIKKNENSIR